MLVSSIGYLKTGVDKSADIKGARYNYTPSSLPIRIKNYADFGHVNSNSGLLNNFVSNVVFSVKNLFSAGMTEKNNINFLG